MCIKKICLNFPVILIVTFLLINIPLFSQDTTQSVMDVNNITSWMANNGFHPWIVGQGGITDSSWNGNFPKGSAGAIFTEGVVWGGLVDDGLTPVLRVSGSTYWNGNYPLTRIYRVRPYYDKIYLRDDAASSFRVSMDQVTDSKIAQVYDQYKKDWNEWPADKGAPFNDINKDGIYEPSVDVPGVPGASQTVWISYDDRNSVDAYGSPPIGLEIQETYWAYSDDDKLGNVIYKSVKIIYKGLSTSKSTSQINNMYIEEFSDPDDGSYTDDFVGCDTVLNLGYVYNSTYNDSVYKKLSMAPPAVGYTFLNGPAKRTGNITDSAIVNFKWHKGYKYFNSRSLSRFITLRSTDLSTNYEPPHSYNGALQFYGIMTGNGPYLPWRGPDVPQPVTYMLSGDPVTKTGQLDGVEFSAGERRIHLISGPINLLLGDTAEVTLALIGGIGPDNISGITSLRYHTNYAIASYNYFIQEMTEGQNITAKFPLQSQPNTLPEHYVLSQNYPNPFNPSTTIEYELPNDAFVKLVIYDILGREVRTLVNEEKAAGSYKVIFNGSNLPSGVYFYRIAFTNSDSKLVNDGLSKVEKMMIIK